MAEITQELLTVKETAEYLRIPLPTVYYLVQRGKLPAIQIGGRWRIKRSLIDRDILKQIIADVIVVTEDAKFQGKIISALQNKDVARFTFAQTLTGLSVLLEKAEHDYKLVIIDSTGENFVLTKYTPMLKAGLNGVRILYCYDPKKSQIVTELARTHVMLTMPKTFEEATIAAEILPHLQ